MIRRIAGRVNALQVHENTFTISCIAMPVDKAITLPRCNAGRQFDPEIVTRFVDLIEAGAIEVRACAANTDLGPFNCLRTFRAFHMLTHGLRHRTQLYRAAASC